jgi:hypothetical protein
MKILFVMRHPAAVRSLGSVLRLLDERGHHVHLAFRRIKTAESHRELQRLADECPRITFGGIPRRGGRTVPTLTAGWTLLAEQLRHDVDFLRYLDPIYADAVELRARAEAKARPWLRGLARFGGRPGVRTLRRSLGLLEGCIPPPPQVRRFVAEQDPAVLLVTHLAEFGSGQTDFVRAARGLGIHSGYPVFSWDNLTNKGLIHDAPELVLVWNELQAAEAVELQGIAREHVKVTGSPSYDHWFDWEPSRSRMDFCAEVGLRADRPLILYVCSSAFVARNEVAFVRRWIGALRAHGGALAEAGITVRPHPRNAKQWVDAELDDEAAVVWPQLGEEPLGDASRKNYFDSIYHSGAVVGINTSAQIESAIVGRPVHTVLAEEFRDTQQGTLHFQYLRADEFGHLYVGRTMEEHLAQLEESLDGRWDPDRNERFLGRFVRPFGLNVAATPLLVDAVEDLAACPAPEPAREPWLAPFVRLALAPKALLMGRRDLRKRREKPAEPLDELRRIARRLGSEQTAAPIVAGPWLADEVGELLYWIPFLRWAQVASFQFRERLVVVTRESSAAWYRGIGSRLVAPDEVGLLGEDVRLMPAELVEERRSDLAARHPGERFLRRMLEFEAPALDQPPADLDLPDDFVAVGFDHAAGGDGVAAPAVARLAAEGPIVLLNPAGPPDDGAIVVRGGRDVEFTVLARARGFVGGWCPAAVVAALLGRPAVAFDAGTASRDDLRLACSFLPTLQVVGLDEQAPDALCWPDEPVAAR